MKRDIYRQLLVWKNNPDHKPLILQGARQVGKTYILKEFGKAEYEDVAYFNFEQDPNLAEFFQGRIDPKSILEKLSVTREKKIHPRKTLIILDEIQESPDALTSLKYFQEQYNEYPIIASGSLLGISLGQNRSFPVGKVNLLHMYPLTFGEYLDGIDKKLLWGIIKEKKDLIPLDQKFHLELMDELKKYYFIGGMPEAISAYKKHADFLKVRQVHKEILKGYEQDFAKHTSKSEAVKISTIWKTIPLELAKENKTFNYSAIQKHARPRDYNESVEWLIKIGLVHKAYRIKTPKLPLTGYIEDNTFKLFILDTGLLGAMLDLSQKTLIDGNSLYSWYSGAFTENYVAQEFVARGMLPLFYWSSGSTAEVDFIISHNDEIWPLEVKAGTNTKAKSLLVYQQKYNPPTLSRASQLNLNKSDKYSDYPLYAVSIFPL